MKTRCASNSMTAKKAAFHGLFEVAFISALLPVTFLTSISVALSSATL